MSSQAISTPRYPGYLLFAAATLQMCFVKADAAADDNSVEARQQRLAEVDGCLMVVITSLLFALCISLCGSVLAYVSFLDDKLLKRYQAEASVVRADVCSADCVRRVGNGWSGCAGRSSDQREYCATIEYNQIISESYQIRVRKQIRALESDFVDPDSGEDNEEKDLGSPPLPPTSIIAKEESFLKTFSLKEKKLDLLVLRDRPMSGYPQKFLKRRLGFLCQVSSICVILSTLCLSLFCIYIAIRAMDDAKDQRERTVAKIAISVFGMLIALEIPITHTFLNESIAQALEEEYFESADLAPTGQDEISLSSCSDMMASTSYYSRLSNGSMQ
jgi:hypothetical protein